MLRETVVFGDGGDLKIRRAGAFGVIGLALASSCGEARTSRDTEHEGRTNGGAGARQPGDGAANGPSRNLTITEIRAAAAPDKIDLVFMLDNSMGMAEKQALLRDAIP